jgi:hypothetical protein
MSRIAFPYPTLFPLIRNPSQWKAIIEGETRDFRDGSGSWDYQADLQISCGLGWQPQALFEQAGLSPLLDGARVALVLSTGSSLQTGRRFVALDQPVREIPDPAELQLTLTSAHLCSKLNITLLIYSSGGNIGGLEVRRGSILYREDTVFQLEGDLASFPLRSISFSESRLGDGLWLVDFSADSPTDPLLSSVTLLLNSDRADFIHRLQKDEDDLLRWIIRADVMASVLSSCLLIEELGFDPLDEYPEQSLGAVVGTWLRGLGIEGISATMRLREEAKREPGILRQRCQAISATEKEVP